MDLSHEMMQDCVSEGNCLIVQPGLLDSVEIFSLSGLLIFFRQFFFKLTGLINVWKYDFLKHNLVLTHTIF